MLHYLQNKYKNIEEKPTFDVMLGFGVFGLAALRYSLWFSHRRRPVQRSHGLSHDAAVAGPQQPLQSQAQLDHLVRRYSMSTVYLPCLCFCGCLCVKCTRFSSMDILHTRFDMRVSNDFASSCLCTLSMILKIKILS